MKTHNNTPTTRLICPTTACPVPCRTGRHSVQLFSVCNDASKPQVNYLFDELQCIGVSGTKVHGLNAVISMLHHSLKSIPFMND